MIFGLLYFYVVISCVNMSRSSFILSRIVQRHSRQSNVRRIWTCADNERTYGKPSKQIYSKRWTRSQRRIMYTRICYLSGTNIDMQERLDCNMKLDIEITTKSILSWVITLSHRQ